jgi:hypothetical protein
MDAEAPRTCSERRPGGPERTSGDVVGAPPIHGQPVRPVTYFLIRSWTVPPDGIIGSTCS